jgi:hypothetical protein
MERDSHTDDQIKKILFLKNIVVIGISKNADEASHYVPKYLAEHGFNIMPVNQTAVQFLDKKCYHSIDEINKEIDIVEIFIPSAEVFPLVKEAIKKKPKVIWMQEGIHNQEAEDLARKKGIDVIFNRCMLKEHQRLMPPIEKLGHEYFTQLKEYDDSTLQQLYDDYYFQSRNYEKYENWYVKAEFAQKILSSQKILDIGCADGRLVMELSNLGIESYGIDGSTYILNQANTKIKNRLFQVNLNGKFPFEDNHFDGIISLHTIEHVHNLDNFMNELSRILKEEGKAWIVTPDTPKEKQNTHDVNLKTQKEWKELFLKHGFIVKKQKQYGFLDMKGKLAPLRLYKLPEPVKTWVKYLIYWYLNTFVSSKNKGKEASFLLIKPTKNSN